MNARNFISYLDASNLYGKYTERNFISYLDASNLSMPRPIPYKDSKWVETLS